MELPESALAFLDAMKRRYACKLFDGRPLDPEIENYILECGRLSPSSFGLEPWLFVLQKGQGQRREALYSACFAQEAIRSAALVLVILVRRAPSYNPDSDFVIERSGRFPGGHPVFKADYEGYHAFLKSEDRLEEWARAQAYIACANMMTGAAAAGIDSCAIEGFKENEVLQSLGFQAQDWRVGIVSVFGYSAEARREKIREGIENLKVEA